MLNRQKILIQILKVAARTVSRFELTKWSFILRHELPSAGGSSFYDFVPYQYGPFSFSLYQELDKLEAMSFVRQKEESVCIDDLRLAQSITIESKDVAADVVAVFKRFGKVGRNDLIEHVYNNYPEYTCNSRIRRLAARPVAKPAVFTAGYEGRSVDSFLNLLVQNGIQRLIDVRRNPIARRYGFHRSTLARLCSRLEIEYVHVPTLGIASDKRRELNSVADYQALFDDYRSGTLHDEKQSISEVSSLMMERPSVLVCMEKDPDFCHRSALADEVSKQTRLSIRNLGCEHGC